MPIDWDTKLARRANRLAVSEIGKLRKFLEHPETVSFVGGIPDPALFPRAEIQAAYHSILSDPARAMAALQYSLSEGYLPLREWLSGYMASLGVTCSPDNIIITNGSQQALDFLGKLFIGPGDSVMVANPTYFGALQAFNGYEPVYTHFPDTFGEDVDRDGDKAPRLGYVMPDFQNPTGTSLSLDDRTALLGFTRKLGMPLIEDAAYEKLRYDGSDLPSLLALDVQDAGGVDNGHVIYCGTFSKTVVPALRVGWVVAPRPIIQKLVLIKLASDLHCSTLNQMVMHEVASETLLTNVDRIRATYKTRRDALLVALERYMPAWVSWTRPQGGMFVWVTLPQWLSAIELLQRAVVEARVAFVPGASFYADGSGHNTFRLSFSLTDGDKMDKGIQRLGELLHKMGENRQTAV
jgi:DNA-binding transcriptional MocR family regulator